MARTVLVVDASPLGPRRVEEALGGTGFRVVAAASGPQAEAAVEAGDIAVVLATVSFPRGNGYDLAKLARARNPEAVVFLTCGGFEVYDAERAERAGVTGRIPRPFTVEALRRHLEGALGPLQAEEESPPEIEPAPLPPEPAPLPLEPELLPADAWQPNPEARPAEPRVEPRAALPATDDERLATFVPRDWRTYPAVSVDPAVVGPAIERAILEILPEVVEAVLAKALQTSRPFRDLVEVAVDEAVRAQVGPIARRVIQERLAEIEAGGDDPG